MKVKVLVAQLYPTLCDPMDCSPTGSSFHGIFQAKIPEWVAILFSFWPKDRTWVSRFVGRFFTVWTTGMGKDKVVFELLLNWIIFYFRWISLQLIYTCWIQWVSFEVEPSIYLFWLISPYQLLCTFLGFEF